MNHDDHEYYGSSSIDDDPHVYDNGVLKNHFGIRSTAELGEVEASLSGLRGIELHENPISGRLDLEHAKKIHHHLFQDIYPWAGQVRSVDIAKGGTLFLPVEKIEEEFDKLSSYLSESGLSKQRIDNEKEFSSAAGIYLGRLNLIHPFREGNGRTQRQLLRMLAQEHGFKIDWSGTSPEAMKRACIEAEDDPQCKAAGKLIFLAQSRIKPDLSSDNGILNSKFFKMIETGNLPKSNDFISEALSSEDKSMDSEYESKPKL
ncbi:Fic/DOC family protein [Pseudomonas putida]|uniref:protein adenylyltransferase n=1 Tax=Pseudomonas putida TaxID=303 RepID=A0A8I1JH54_PSEPU|nr:Fic family protein [Pseudomonas putida]MBI6882336.1 Fic family protein [Pseudomonas putida]